MVDHGEPKHPQWMTAQNRPVHDDKKNARTHQRCEESDDAEVPYLVRIDSCNARGALRTDKRKQRSKRSQSAVRRNNDRADVEEDGMHLSKDNRSECSESRTRPTGP